MRSASPSTSPLRRRLVIAGGAAMLAASAGGVAVAQGSTAEPGADGHGDRGVRAVNCPDRGPELPGPYELPTGDEVIQLDPAYFTSDIDNPWWPMTPGRTWEYRESNLEGDVEHITVTVTDDTRLIEGIEARVVHDVARDDEGQLIEDTYDWYAQDCGGSIWYLGEDTAEYEDGEIVSTEGSWEYGVDGAQAGIVVPAEPEVGWAYRQEYLAGEAEDRGEVLSLGDVVEVPYGFFDDVLTTRDTTPLEQRVDELKFFARGVGPVLAVEISGGSAREVLVDTSAG